MTKEIITNKEILNMEQLDSVNGGTVAEFTDIWSALEKQAGALGTVDSALRTILDHLPGGKIGTAAWRNVAAPLAEKALKECYGIDAYISIGWGGSDFRSSGNTYSKNGKGLSHQEVLNIINNAA